MQLCCASSKEEELYASEPCAAEAQDVSVKPPCKQCSCCLIASLLCCPGLLEVSGLESHLQQVLAHCPFALHPSQIVVAACDLLSVVHAGKMRTAESALTANISVPQRRLRRVLAANRHRRAPASGR